MNERPSDRLAIAVAQLNPTVGDIAGNADKARAARADAARAGRRSRRVARAVHLPAIRPRIWCSSRPCRRPAARAIEELARETADGGPAHADRHALGGGRQALQCLLRCSTAARIAARALQGRPAELRRVRREAGVRAGPAAGTGQFPRRAPRRAGLRGHLGRPSVVEMPGRDRRRIADRAERLALLARQGRRCASTSRSRASPRAACR